MAFYQKYRSKKFGDLIGQEHVASTLLESIKTGTLVHAYLLTGPRGIGKTSTARLLAKAINCKALKEGEPCNECESCLDISAGRSLDVIEIDAASHTGVDDIRDLIDKARLAPSKAAKKVYIIDEVHMLSKSAFNALLKTLEEPPAHVVFIMATTEIHKVPATIISRIQRFDFKRASKPEIIDNLKKVAGAEKIEIDDESLDVIALAANGGHRDALSLLEQVSAASGKQIEIKTTRKILGIAEDREVLMLTGAIFNNNPEEGLKIARRLFEDGHDLVEFSRKVVEMLRKAMIYKVTGADLVEDTAENLAKISEISEKTTLTDLMAAIKIFLDASQLFKEVQYPMLPLEIAVIKSAELSHKKLVEKAVEAVATESDKPAATSSQAESKAKEQDVRKVAFVPVPVIEMTKDIWYQVIELTKKENSTLAALLRDAKPEQLTKDTMTLGVKFPFHKDRISEPKNTAALEKIICAVTGVNYQLVCKIADNNPKQVAGETPVDLEKAVAEVFEV